MAWEEVKFLWFSGLGWIYTEVMVNQVNRTGKYHGDCDYMEVYRVDVEIPA